MNFDTIKLSQCCTSIADGDHQPPPKAESGIPFITISNIIANQIDFSDTMYVPIGYYDSLDEKRKAKKGDILYSVVGSFGIPVFVKEDRAFVFQRHIAILRPNENIVAPRYLYYVMLSKEFYGKADATAIGAAQRTISLTSLRNIEIKLPNIEIQHRIADILSAYDDLIENNRKQIKLLEEAAQRLYREWFVDLRFPGWENTKIVDGVPEGWSNGQACDFYDITIGKTPPRVASKWFLDSGNGIPWVSISDMGNTDVYVFSTSEDLTGDAIKSHNVKIVPRGTVLLSFKLTVGRVSITGTDMCTNEAIAHFRIVDDYMREYTYCYLKNYNYDSLGSTSSISKAVNSKIIKAMPYILPSKNILVAFSKLANPILEQIKNKQKQNIQLAEERDRLLPKLMSGELEV